MNVAGVASVAGFCVPSLCRPHSVFFLPGQRASPPFLLILLHYPKSREKPATPATPATVASVAGSSRQKNCVLTLAGGRPCEKTVEATEGTHWQAEKTKPPDSPGTRGFCRNPKNPHGPAGSRKVGRTGLGGRGVIFLGAIEPGNRQCRVHVFWHENGDCATLLSLKEAMSSFYFPFFKEV